MLLVICFVCCMQEYFVRILPQYASLSTVYSLDICVKLHCLGVVSRFVAPWLVLHILSLASCITKLFSYSHFIQNIQKMLWKTGKRASSRTSVHCWEQCHLAAHSSLEECYRKPRAVETAGRAAQWLSPSVFTLGLVLPVDTTRAILTACVQQNNHHAPSLFLSFSMGPVHTHSLTYTHTPHLLFSTAK